MIEDSRTCTLEQQTGLLDFAIASHIEQGFALRERTATTALLVRRRRYNRLASIATGIVPYYIYFLLFAADTSMALEVDALGRVQCRQGTIRHARRMAVGVVLALLVAAIVVGITTFSAKEVGQQYGVHICAGVNYDSEKALCLLDDANVSLASLPLARITAASTDGSTLSGQSIRIVLKVQDTPGSYRVLNSITVTVPPAVTRSYALLSTVFQVAGVTPAAGAYLVDVTSTGTTANGIEGVTSTNLGSATFTLTP